MYDIRHAFITSLLEQGADLQTVAEIAGHNIDTMIKSYQHLTQRLRKKTISQLPGLGNTILPKTEK
jgi:site-specific recombinase XerD